MAGQTPTFSIRIPSKIREKIDGRAEREDESAAFIILDILNSYFERKDGEKSE